MRSTLHVRTKSSHAQARMELVRDLRHAGPVLFAAECTVHECVHPALALLQAQHALLQWWVRPGYPSVYGCMFRPADLSSPPERRERETSATDGAAAVHVASPVCQSLCGCFPSLPMPSMLAQRVKIVTRPAELPQARAHHVR